MFVIVSVEDTNYKTSPFEHFFFSQKVQLSFSALVKMCCARAHLEQFMLALPFALFKLRRARLRSYKEIKGILYQRKKKKILNFHVKQDVKKRQDLKK